MSNHGGKRKGAGRKADPDAKKMITTKLSPDVIDYLATVDNKSLTIETALRRTRGFRDWRKTNE